MKKNLLALVGIVMIASISIFYSCNKEVNTISSGNVENEITQSNEKTQSTWEQQFYPHFRWRTPFLSVPLELCDKPSGKFCGFYIDDILNGDETCWLMMYENDPCRIYIPTKVLLANHVNELIDSAHTGAMTYHSDFELMSESLIETVGTDLIPAGRYPTYLTTYKGDSVVCICLDTIL
jgi:hypothetical protein